MLSCERLVERMEHAVPAVLRVSSGKEEPSVPAVILVSSCEVARAVPALRVFSCKDGVCCVCRVYVLVRMECAVYAGLTYGSLLELLFIS